ncbi:MAG TPA: site-2 protease family protein [Dictyobacter sp.]|jgi:Zn-dependent protease|nr:site-2 protease family protein [Dictyobacter sp.]
MQKIDVVLALMIIGSFLVALPLHEWAHSQMASWLGDRTPRAEGRQTLRFQPHVDPVGMLMCVILAFQSAVGLGWGKPVKPDPWKLRVGANTGVLLVACAGLVFSLLVGLVFAVITRWLLPVIGESVLSLFVLKLLTVFACVNVGLAIFNLIPLYPLDGYQILYTLLPSKQAVQFARSAMYGPFIILAIFFFLPFLAQLAGLGQFPLFRLAYYIRQGAFALMSLVSGLPYNDAMGIFQNLYIYGQSVL